MYVPPPFRPTDPRFAAGLMRRESFAVLVSHHAGDTQATHLPLVFDDRAGRSGMLRGHLALPNPQAQHLRAGVELLAIFAGPHAYVSPSWYETKKTVPTWNYVAVHAYGRPRLLEGDELMAHLRELVEAYESPRAEPWALDAVPREYVANLSGGVIGFEMAIHRLDAKAKLGQNRSEADRRGAIAGLRAEGDAEGRAVAALMEEAMERGA